MESHRVSNRLELDLGYPGITIYYELWALETYLSSVEQHLPFAQDQFKIRAERKMEKNVKGMATYEINSQLRELDEVIDIVLPRFFRGPFILALWALFESSMEDLASYAQKKDKNKLSLSDLRRKNSELDKIFKYFSAVLIFPELLEKDIVDRLDDIRFLRNIVAHQNGRAIDLSDKKRDALERVIKKNDGVNMVSGYLTFSPEYLRRSLEHVRLSLQKIMRVFAEKYGPSASL